MSAGKMRRKSIEVVGVAGESVKAHQGKLAVRAVIDQVKFQVVGDDEFAGCHVRCLILNRSAGA
jgi:hypothetical protein